MTVVKLLQWQYAGYAKFHQSRFNLLLHVVAVPLFMFGSALLVVSLANLALMYLAWNSVAIAVMLMIVSVAIQGRGHDREVVPPEPFTGPMNIVSRIFLEQWVTFPRFVFSGGWLRAWRLAARPS